MKRFFFKALKILGVLLGIGLVVILVIIYTSKFRISDEEAKEEMANSNTQIAIEYHDHGRGKTRSILADKGNDDLLILLHGSPSSSAQWVPLVNDSTLSQKADFLMIDRPGYGYSDFGRPILSVKKVTAIIHDIVEKYGSAYDQVFVLGTSYGGTVAARLLMDFPDFVDAGILISSSMAPGEEKTYPISYFMDRVPWLFPKFLMVANHEKLSHYDELKEMEPHWSKIADPVYFIHSTADELVYPSNVEFVLQRLNPTLPVKVHWVQDGDHSLFWSERKLFKQKLNEFLDGAIFSPKAELYPSGR